MAAPTPPPPPLLGVSASFLQWFLPFIDTSLTTREVCEHVILPGTQERGGAFINVFRSLVDISGRALIAPANVYVSHAWDSRFHDTCAVVLQEAAARPDAYFWIDLFVHNQHDTAERPHDWWTTTLASTIAATGTVLVVLTPWSDPVALRRAWCLWELGCAVEQKVQVRVCLPAVDRTAIIDMFAKDYKTVTSALAHVHPEKARAQSALDEDAIFSAIRSGTGGMAGFAQRIKQQLRQCVVDMIVAAIERLEASNDTATDAYPALCHNLGACLEEFGDYTRALEYLQLALGRYITSVGSLHATTAKIYNRIGSVLCSRGDYTNALQLHLKALSIFYNVNACSNEDTAVCYNFVGSTLLAMGKHRMAGEAFKRALSIRRATSGNMHPLVAIGYNNIGCAMLANGDAQAAVSILTHSLLVSQAAIGEHNIGTAGTLINLGHAYTASRDYDAAIACIDRAITILQEMHGEHTQQIAICRLAAGHIHASQGNYARAITHFEDALQIQLSLPASARQDAAHTHSNLGNAYWKDGQYANALAHFGKAADNYHAAMGETHPFTVEARKTLRCAVAAKSILDKMPDRTRDDTLSPALPVSLDTIPEPIAVQVHASPPHLSTTAYAAERSQGQVHLVNVPAESQPTTRPARSLAHYVKTLNDSITKHGRAHPQTAANYIHIGNIYATMGDFGSALEFLEIGLQINLETKGESFTGTANSYSSIAAAYKGKGDFARAISVYTKAAASWCASVGEQHPSTAAIYNNIADVYNKMGETAAAIEYYEKSLAIVRATLGENHTITATTYSCLGAVYERTHDTERARACHEKATAIYAHIAAKSRERKEKRAAQVDSDVV